MYHSHISVIISSCPYPSTDKKDVVCYTAVSGFIFLRFFAPAILNPRLFHLRPEFPVSLLVVPSPSPSPSCTHPSIHTHSSPHTPTHPSPHTPAHHLMHPPILSCTHPSITRPSPHPSLHAPPNTPTHSSPRAPTHCFMHLPITSYTYPSPHAPTHPPPQSPHAPTHPLIDSCSGSHPHTHLQEHSEPWQHWKS